MILSVTILCDPPLGQSTVIPHDRDAIDVHVVLQSNAALSSSTTEVIVWHNCHDDDRWAGLALSLTTTQSPLRRPCSQDLSLHHSHFSGLIRRPAQGPGAFEFTLKYRTHAHEDSWIWASPLAPSPNGSLIFQAPSLPTAIDELFSRFDASSALTVRSSPSEAPSTRLWTLALPIPAASDDTSAATSAVLGVPLAVNRWTATVRRSAAWLAPRHGKGVWRTDEDAWVAAFLRRDGLHVVLLGVAGVNDTEVVFGDDDFGAVVVKARNDAEEEEAQATVLAAVGYEMESALAACMYRVQRMLEPEELVVEPMDQGQADQGRADGARGDGVKAAWMEEWWDGLGYSTWNALGLELREERILEALKDLEEQDVKVSNLFIDDGWQSVDTADYTHESRWTEFEAREKGFPNGLAETITKIKEKHPTIEHIGVWHAMLGYWSGIAPDGTISHTYPTQTLPQTPTPAIPGSAITVVPASNAEQLYTDFYAFLASAGVTAVKTDVQCALDLLTSPPARRAFAAAYPAAWTRAHLTSLAGRAIACMAHVPALLLRTHLPSTRPRVLLRTSDDFFPAAPRAAHGWHVLANAHNALWAQFLNVVPDWDMFQTGHVWGSFHAAARCLSGGAVVVSDEPGTCDAELVRRVVARTVRGKSVALRPSAMGKVRPSSAYTAHGEPRLLRIGAYHGAAETGVSFLGVFNVGDGPLAELVVLRDFPGIADDRPYVVRAYAGRSLAEPMTAGAGSVPLPLSLDEGTWEIFTAHPVTNVNALGAAERTSPGPEVAVLGLIDKMTGAAAVIGTTIEVQRQRLRVSTTLKALGKLGLSDRKQPLLGQMLTECRHILFPNGAARHRRGPARDDSWPRGSATDRVRTGTRTGDRRGAGVARDAAGPGIQQ